MVVTSGELFHGSYPTSATSPATLISSLERPRIDLFGGDCWLLADMFDFNIHLLLWFGTRSIHGACQTWLYSWIFSPLPSLPYLHTLSDDEPHQQSSELDSCLLMIHEQHHVIFFLFLPKGYPDLECDQSSHAFQSPRFLFFDHTSCQHLVNLYRAQIVAQTLRLLCQWNVKRF